MADKQTQRAGQDYKVAFFKPYQGKGTAFLLSFNDADQKLFLTTMPERSDKPDSFDSKGSINFKLGPSDVGELMAVLSGRKDGAGTQKDGKWSGIYHEVEGKSTSILHAAWKEDGRLGVSLYRKLADGNKTTQGLNLLVSEATLVLEFFRSIMKDFFRDTWRANASMENKPAAKTAGRQQNEPQVVDEPF